MHASGEGLAKKRLTHRSLLRKAEMHTGVVITTYGGLRNNDFQLLSLDWNYVILDEGHLIRNPDAQITQIAKRLRSRHRLILTGAPVRPLRGVIYLVLCCSRHARLLFSLARRSLCRQWLALRFKTI